MTDFLTVCVFQFVIAVTVCKNDCEDLILLPDALLKVHSRFSS